jgi:hypothetical protein
MEANGHTVKEHFENRAPKVKATYQAILKAAKSFGPVKEEAKRTSIHLVRKSAFAGVATRKTALILTLKSDSDIASERIAKREQASAHRWHVEVKLETPAQVDREIAAGSRKRTNSRPNFSLPTLVRLLS